MAQPNTVSIQHNTSFWFKCLTTSTPIFIGLVIGLIVVFFSPQIDPLHALLYILSGIILMIILFRFPEISFALFLTAGHFKAGDYLSSIMPRFIDLTILFGIIALLAIIINIFKKRFKIPYIPKKFILPYLGISALLLLSLTYTEAPIYGTDKLLRFITLTSLAALAPLFLLNNKIKLKRFFYTIITLSTIMTINAFVFASRFVLGSNYLALGRITGISILIILFYFIIRHHITKKTLLWLTLLILNLAGLFYSGGRGPIVALLLTIIFILFISFNFKRVSINKYMLFGFLIIMLLTSIAFLFLHQITQTSLIRFKVMLTQATSGTLTRLTMYTKAIEALRFYPLSGVGIGGFSMFAYGTDSRLYPHNIFLEIGAESGLLGFSLFLCLVGFCLFYLMSLRKKYNREKYFLTTTILALFIFMLLKSLVSGDINDNRLLFVWIGVTYTLKNIFKDKNLLKKSVLIDNKN